MRRKPKAMFGIGEDKKQDFKAGRVGAREKIAKAQEALGKGPAALAKQQKKKTPPAVTIGLIYVLAFAIAYMLTEGPISHGRWTNLHFGMPSLEFFLFSSGHISFVGSDAIDDGIRMALRALIIFLLAGFFPFLSLFWFRLLDNQNTNPYRVFWGVPVGFFAVVIFFGLYLGSFVEAISAIL